MNYFKQDIKNISYIIGGLIAATLLSCKHQTSMKTFKLAQCSRKADVDVMLTRLFLVDKSDYNSEGNNILVDIEIKNNSDQTINVVSINSYSASGNITNLITPKNNQFFSLGEESVFVSGFFLISNQLKTGALKFYGGENTTYILKAKHAEHLTLWSNCVYLRSFLLAPIAKDDDIQYDDVLHFFTKANYYFVYVSSKDSSALVIPKSKEFKVIRTNNLTHVVREMSGDVR